MKTYARERWADSRPFICREECSRHRIPSVTHERSQPAHKVVSQNHFMQPFQDYQKPDWCPWHSTG